jgi:hypothetical protein
MSDDPALSRRNFIRAAGLMTGALLLSPWPLAGAGGSMAARPVNTVVKVPGKEYLGTADGLIYESVDGGQSWQRVANFGQHCAVLTLRERQGQIHARIGLKDQYFTLTSANARTWHTA